MAQLRRLEAELPAHLEALATLEDGEFAEHGSSVSLRLGCIAASLRAVRGSSADHPAACLCPLSHRLHFFLAEDLARTAADQLVTGLLEARRVAEARGWDVEERAAEEEAALRRLLGLAAGDGSGEAVCEAGAASHLLSFLVL